MMQPPREDDGVTDERDTTGRHPAAEELSAYHDGEIDAQESVRIDAHLKTCPACTALLVALADVDQLGRDLNEDLPGPDFWPGLEERILRRVAEEGGAPEGVIPAPTLNAAAAVTRAAAPREDRTGWIERAFGWKRLGWTVATAAALGVVILTSREILHQSPVEPEVAFRSREAVTGQRDQAGSASEAGKTGEPAGPEAAGAEGVPPPAMKNSTADHMSSAPVADERSAAPATENKADAGGPGSFPSEIRLDKGATPSASVERNRTDGAHSERTLLGEDSPPGAKSEDRAAREAGSAPPAQTGVSRTEASPSPPVSAPKPSLLADGDKRTAGATPSGSMGLTASPEEDAAGAGTAAPDAVTGRQDSGGLDPAVYVAEVNRRLDRRKSGADAGVVPPGDDAASRLAEASSRFAKEKSPFRDFRIVYAAAFRAMEAQEYELAARGFELVSSHVPGSDLARDADVQGRLARFRILLGAGSEPRDVLRRASAQAEASWQAAEGNPGPETCRAALADEKVRLLLLGEFDPAADRGPYEERVRTLSRCS